MAFKAEMHCWSCRKGFEFEQDGVTPPWLNQLEDLKSKHLKGRCEIFCKRKNTLEDDLIQAHMHFLGAAGKGCEDSSYLKIFELVDISPSQQLLHTGKVSIEHWNMAPMDWVGILGQKYWINLQTKYLKYFNTDIFVRSNGTSTERLLVAFTLYHSGNAEIYQVFSISKILVDHQNWNVTKIFIIINTRINLINTITNTLTLKCCL